MKHLTILVELGHPAHVHFFKNPIKLWEEWGHRVLIVTREKEITHQLLDELNIPYLPLSKQQTGKLAQAFELLVRWIKTGFLIKKHKADIAISISGISTAVPARLCGIASITVQDTEDAAVTNAIAFRFSDRVLTPTTFLKQSDFANITTYNAFHELAYLHPHWFTPDKTVLRQFQVSAEEKYVVIRLVKWKALHDINEHGINEAHLQEIIDHVAGKGYRVFLSSERPLSACFERYHIRGPLSQVFHLMAFSQGYIGESPTMAVETVILGKPAVLINSRVSHLGNMVELQEKYGLLYNAERYEDAVPFLQQEFFSPDLRQRVEAARERLLQEKMDISAWIAELVVNSCLERRR
jgi:predicted glycosyltransferase